MNDSLGGWDIEGIILDVSKISLEGDYEMPMAWQ